MALIKVGSTWVAPRQVTHLRADGEFTEVCFVGGGSVKVHAKRDDVALQINTALS